MLIKIKKRLYFVVASYFGFWARIVLARWKPRIIVVTGSSGKTTTLHLIESQIGDKAVYSHHANGAIGIPFHILGMETNVPRRSAWLAYIVKAPFKIGRKLPSQNLYVVEADCERPNEGKFVSKLLKPEAVVWVSVYRTHSMYFDKLVKSGKFGTHEQAIAYEFGYFAAAARKLAIVNGDQPVVVEQLSRVAATTEVAAIASKDVKDYSIKDSYTEFVLPDGIIQLPGLHPREVGNSLQMVNKLLAYLELPLDPKYQRLEMPPGRSNIFSGKKGITIIDSTYNTGLGAMTAILNLFGEYQADHKWAVLGDILEQGSLEPEEHAHLAEVIAKLKLDRVVFLGPRTKKYSVPVLQKLRPELEIVTFESPKDVLDYLKEELKGGEVLLFKGGRFLEGVIDQLLENPADTEHLVRREAIWTKRRQKWGLPR